MNDHQGAHTLVEFARTFRKVFAVVLVAWLILMVARFTHLEQANDPFQPVHPPFQAVTSQPGSAQQLPAAGRTIRGFIQNVLQYVLYNPR